MSHIRTDRDAGFYSSIAQGDQQRQRNPILVVTHQIDVLAPICDRITYLRDGQLSEAPLVESEKNSGHLQPVPAGGGWC